MITNKMAKFFIKLIFFLQLSLFTAHSLNASEHSFKNWLENFKKVALSEGVSERYN